MESTHGYDSDRLDELINAEITFPDGIHNVRIFIDKYIVVIKYKYTQYYPVSGRIVVSGKEVKNPHRYHSERKHIHLLVLSRLKIKVVFHVLLNKIKVL